MKKIVVIAAVAAAVVSAKAASVDWNVSATSSEVGYTVYLLTSIAESYADVAALADAAVASASITSLPRGKYGTGTVTSTKAGITTASMADAYYAIVMNAEAPSFTYVSIGDLSSKVYDAGAQQTSPGSFNTVDAATILAGTSKSFSGGETPVTPTIPEPTSGLLMLVGLGALALRRRR